MCLYLVHKNEVIVEITTLNLDGTLSAFYSHFFQILSQLFQMMTINSYTHFGTPYPLLMQIYPILTVLEICFFKSSVDTFQYDESSVSNVLMKRVIKSVTMNSASTEFQ